MVESGRSIEVELDGSNDSNWTVMYENQESYGLKVDGREVN